MVQSPQSIFAPILYLFTICEDTYFVRSNKYLWIYEDTFEQRYLDMIAH